MRADLYSFEDLWRQYRACRRNKRNTLNQLRFEIDAERNLLDLQRELRGHTYQPGPSICFVTDGPKPREVFAADFRDRIVHHLLVSRLEAIFEPRFIHDSYACRKGKGVLAASDQLMEFMRRVTRNGQRPAWALHLDVARFFASIDKETLYRIIARRIRDPEVLWLTGSILFHDPTTNYRFRRGPRGIDHPGSLGYPVPSQRSLFGANNERGLPIGNLTSQFWANVYLNELDQFAKRRLRCRHYVRYVDDLVLLDEDQETLREWRERIGDFLQQELKLALREPKAEPKPTRRGIEFVGWKTFYSYRLPRKRTLASCDRRLERFEQREVRNLWRGAARCIAISRRDGGGKSALEALHATLASYSGHLRHGATWDRWTALWQRYPWLDAIFAREGWGVRLRWPTQAIGGPRFARQYRRLVRKVGERTLVFCQVGTFIEFYGLQRLLATDVLRLSPAAVPRGGFGLCVGFPAKMRVEYVSRAVRAGCVAVDVREVGQLSPRCAQRQVTCVFFA